MRDALLGVPAKDLDVEVFGVPVDDIPAMAAESASHQLRVGRSFPVWKVWDSANGHQETAIDIAVPRRERLVGHRHGDFDVTADPSMSYSEASLRRDFTINALGYDPLKGEILDTVNGLADLTDRKLRHVSARFVEDPLRVLRGMQLIGRIGLDPDPSTITLCQQLNPKALPAERMMEEWTKLLLRGNHMREALHFLRQTEWDSHFGFLRAIEGVPQDPKHHPEGDVWTHTAHCLDAFAARRTGDSVADVRVGFAVLTHDFGKVTHTTWKDGRWSSYGHEEAGVAPARAFMQMLTDDSSLIASVSGLVGAHMRPKLLFKDCLSRSDRAYHDSAVRRLSNEMARHGTNLRELALVVECDTAGRPPLPEASPASEWLIERGEQLQCDRKPTPPLLLGRDLLSCGIPPGRPMGKMLEEVRELQLSGALATREDALAFIRSRMSIQRASRPLPTPSVECGAGA